VVSVEDQQAVADIIGKHLASFYINELRCTEFIVINVLFDTGSPVSFVIKTSLPKDVTLANPFESKYREFTEEIFCYAAQLNAILSLI